MASLNSRGNHTPIHDIPATVILIAPDHALTNDILVAPDHALNNDILVALDHAPSDTSPVAPDHAPSHYTLVALDHAPSTLVAPAHALYHPTCLDHRLQTLVSVLEAKNNLHK